jgi:phosphoesterase RecJ-like protein
MDETNNAIRTALADSQRILLMTHERPDGDAIGSLMGLGLALREAGKQVQMVIIDGVQRTFRHLQGAELVEKAITPGWDLSVVVDCSDMHRTGDLLPDQDVGINIDHHITNLNFAKINLVNPKAAATAEIITENLEGWGLNFSQPVANALLTGIISDTIGFRTSNVLPQTLRLAALLMEQGADLPELYNQALVRRSFEAARLWGIGLNRMQRQGRMVWTSISLDERRSVSYPGKDDADLTNILSAIEDTDIAVIFLEKEDQRVKISWRAQPGIDVSNLAVHYGGGGHPAAAGAEINGAMEEVIPLVLQATEQLINSNNHANSLH